MGSILIIGGARSGKSHYAQELALKSGQPVLFVATAQAGDEEMRQRIAEHRRSRPATWHTIEVTTHVGHEIRQNIGGDRVVIIDCITLLVSNIFGQFTDESGELIDSARVEAEAVKEIDELIECLNRLDASFIIVTNEVGAGLVPTSQMGRLYRDVLGRTNRRLAESADRVYLMVAGLPVAIKPPASG